VNANPHLAAAPLEGGAPAGDATAAAVLVHGRGSGAAPMLALADHLALDRVHFVAPQAANGTWYPLRFIEPVERNEPWLTFALDACESVVAGLGEAGWPPERVALVGFSQGACLTLEYVARHPRRYGAVAALTGGLIGADGALTHPAAGLEATPMLVTGVEADAWVPPERTRESAAILAAAGADVDLRVFEPAPHGVREEEIAAVRELLRPLL
jgi:predicted esterase